MLLLRPFLCLGCRGVYDVQTPPPGLPSGELVCPDCGATAADEVPRERLP